MSSVLVVDDDPMIRDHLARTLERAGFVAFTAADGAAALEVVGKQHPDLIVLDVLMPRADGREVLARLRRGGDWTPVILLTGVGQSGTRADALEKGADDYLNKPFDPAELVARIRAVLRRTQGSTQPLTAAPRLVAGDLVLDRAARRVEHRGREVALTPKATMLLEYLMSHPGELFSRESLLASLWGIDFTTTTRAVDHRVREIRQVLGEDAARPLYIETVPSMGYRFRAEVHA